MQLLKDKIKKDGVVINGEILKVDSFLNHQIDPDLMLKIGKEFAKRFENCQIDRVLTIEASGIAMAMATGMILQVPVIFAKKGAASFQADEAYCADVYSFTKKMANKVSVLKKFLPQGQKVLIIDDFMAHGEAAMGLAEIVEQAQCEVVGIGVVIEKSFQGGADKLIKAGYRLESLAKIKAFENNTVVLE